jgi:hypothetical protein
MSYLEIIDTNLPETAGVTKRMIADAFRDIGNREILYEPDNRRMTYARALASMLWQAAVDGVVYFSDGTTLKVSEDAKVWLDTIKFLANHLDGPAGNTANFTGINVFKVYRGVDPDRV